LGGDTENKQRVSKPEILYVIFWYYILSMFSISHLFVILSKTFHLPCGSFLQLKGTS